MKQRLQERLEIGLFALVSEGLTPVPAGGQAQAQQRLCRTAARFLFPCGMRPDAGHLRGATKHLDISHGLPAAAYATPAYPPRPRGGDAGDWRPGGRACGAHIGVARTIHSLDQPICVYSGSLWHSRLIPNRDGGRLQLVLPFFSYMALHNDYTHLTINCLWLLAFGPIVARRFGAPLFLLFFLICGVAGAATHLAFNWGSPEPVIGASAAISGLMAAGIRLLPTQRPPWAADGAPAEAPMLPIRSRQIILFTLVWAALNVVAGLTGLGMGGEAGLIAWQAHMGGFVAGLFCPGPSTDCGPSRWVSSFNAVPTLLLFGCGGCAGGPSCGTGKSLCGPAGPDKHRSPA